MGVIENTLAFVFVLGVMVLIHELGHFWAARYFKVRVEAFAFGFGPRLLGFRRGDTDYKVCLLPLGGYVKMAGENMGEPTGDPDEFLSKPRWQRLIIIAMGPLFNGILAVALLQGLYMVHFERPAYMAEPPVIATVREGSAAEKEGLRPGDQIVSFDSADTPTWESVRLAEITAVDRSIPTIIRRDGDTFTVNLLIGADSQGAGTAGWIPSTGVRLDPIEGSPAARAGIELGDLIVAIEGQPIRRVDDALEMIRSSGGSALSIALQRGERTVTVQVTPEFDESSSPDDPAYRIGSLIGPEYTLTELSFGDALKQSVRDNTNNATLIFSFLRGLVEQRMSPKSLEGPIGIARLSGEAAQRGWPDLVMLMATISLNLGILNLLPIPILDGGGIVLLLFESVIRRDISVEIKERIVQVGLVFLVLLFAFVMYNDILKTLPSG